jgi:hypothetical protein
MKLCMHIFVCCVVIIIIINNDMAYEQMKERRAEKEAQVYDGRDEFVNHQRHH